MPGLFGILLKRQDQIDPHSLSCLAQRMADAMRHVPWLETELWRSETFCGGRIHLGNLNPMSQPMVSRDRRRYVWFDGHFFATATTSKHQTPSADEVIALLKDPRALSTTVDGVFNVACFNAEERELVLVNDRLGFRPLYYTETADWFAYASEVKALLVIREKLPDLDDISLRQFFSRNWIFGDRTWWKGIELLPPASIWRITVDTDSRRRYWTFDDLPLDRIEPPDAETEFARLWSLEVQRHSRPGTMPILLSGGLDSRLLLAELQRQGVDVVAVTFGSADSPEVQRARLVTRAMQIPHRICHLDTTNWWHRRDEAIWHVDGLVNGDHLHSATTMDELHAWSGYSAINIAGDLLFGGSHLNGASFMPSWEVSTLEGRLRSIYIENPFCSREEFASVSLEDAVRYAKGPRSDCFYLSQHFRRYILYFPIGLMTHCEIGFPGLSYDLLRLFLGTLPDEARRESRFYNHFLADRYRRWYLNIPWERTGRGLVETLPIRSWRSARGQLRRSLRSVGRWTGRFLSADLRRAGRTLLAESDAERVPMTRWFVDYKRCVEETKLRERLLQKELILDQYLHGAVRRVLSDSGAPHITPRLLIAILTSETYLRQVDGISGRDTVNLPTNVESVVT